MYRRIRHHIVHRLYRKKAYAKGHLLEENIFRGLARHEWKKARQVLDILVKSDIVRVYGKTKHGIAYQLNMEYLQDIQEIVNEHF